MSIDPDQAEAIDSKCSSNPIGANGPTDVWCGNNAVAYCFRPGGHRSYLCHDHVEQANRFGDDVFTDGPPTLETCKRCVKPTPRDRTNIDGICEECER